MFRVAYELDDQIVCSDKLHETREDAKREHAMARRGMDDLGFIHVHRRFTDETLLNLNHVTMVYVEEVEP